MRLENSSLSPAGRAKTSHRLLSDLVLWPRCGAAPVRRGTTDGTRDSRPARLPPGLLISLSRGYNACPGATDFSRFTSRLAGLGLSE
jgi:hypothetical protein